MAEPELRNRAVHQFAVVVATVSVVAGVVLIGWGSYLLASPAAQSDGAIPVVAGLALIMLALTLQALFVIARRAEGNINRIHADTLDLLDLMQRLEPMVKALADNSEISDAALSITHREKEREVLRQAIRDEMLSGNIEGTVYLIDEIERRFGHKQEAKALRQELAEIREMTIEEKIGEAISHIEQHMTGFLWDRAHQEAERLMKLFPRHERVMGLLGELGRRRETRKKELLAQWNTAVQRDEIDKGVAILTELDPYLTRGEAQQLQDSARHVFKARLLNLGVKFSLAVSENRWRDALEVGLQLRQEFPNSRMAQEVGDKMETLRVRAGFVADAEVVQQRPKTPAAG